MLCLMLATGLQAEDKVLQQIEVTAQKDAHTTQLSGDEVRESSAPDIGEALQNTPGLNKLRKGGIASDILLRGLKGDNINVLVDGERVYGACPNRMDPPSFHIDFGEVDSIEITKGPYDVRNSGSMGGLVDIKTKGAKKGLHSEGSVSISSFGRSDHNANASYGSDTIEVLAGGAYHQSDVYRDGNGQRFTGVYADYYNEQILQSRMLSSNTQLNSLVQMAPHKFPHIYQGTAPSPNRYRYSDRDNLAYVMRTGWSQVAFKPTAKQKIELRFSRQEADNVMYPYLLMDGNFDTISRGHIAYTITDISPELRELKFKAFSSFVDHFMTDELRCSSAYNAGCEYEKERPWSMATQANTRVNGGK
ncbi:MAG: TonB-dependent receptor plug domain-containing protein, partial [Leptospiraceae bacterium]|nr:TonB-dependent receptor plug domain-containing protein [Leptospiraceae bacterium]